MFLKFRDLDRTLATAQLATLGFAALDLSAAVLLHKWNGISHFQPMTAFAASLQIALPPAIIAAASFGIAVLTGVPIRDVPRTVLGFLRNRFLQSYGWMVPFIAVSVVFVGCAAATIATQPPPHYDKIVNAVMGGESDDQKIAHDLVAELRIINLDVARDFSAVVAVFEERRKFNSGDRSAARANVLVRQLDANIAPEWSIHPLRLHALAEANVLAAQASAAGRVTSPTIVKDQFESAIALYTRVFDSGSPLATDLLRQSAMHNLGNVHLYRGDYAEAAQVYKSMVSNPDYVNTSSWGNLIALYVYQQKYDDAIREGLKAKGWAESAGKAFTEAFPYASILENTAAAYWGKAEFEKAHEFFDAANAFRDDPLNRTNLALSYRFTGHGGEAVRIMRRVSAPADSENFSSKLADQTKRVCDYIAWAAILPEDDLIGRSLNLSVFLQEYRNIQDIRHDPAGIFSKLAKQALQELRTIHEPCKSLQHIPAFEQLVLASPPQ